MRHAKSICTVDGLIHSPHPLLGQYSPFAIVYSRYLSFPKLISSSLIRGLTNFKGMTSELQHVGICWSSSMKATRNLYLRHPSHMVCSQSSTTISSAGISLRMQNRHLNLLVRLVKRKMSGSNNLHGRSARLHSRTRQGPSQADMFVRDVAVAASHSRFTGDPSNAL